MPGKSRGGRKGDANLSPCLSSHAQIRPHTCENVEVQRREVNTSGRKPRFRPLASRLYLHSRKLSPPCTHRAVQLFAFLVLIRRRCYAGKGVTLSFRNAIFHHRLPLLLFLLVLSLSLEKRQGRKGTMVMAKQRSTSRCSIENATNAAIKTKWWLVTRRLFSPLHSSPPSLVFKLVLRSCNTWTSFDIPVSI